MSYKKNITSNFVTQIAVSALAFITSIFVARSLQATNKGYVQYFILIFGLLGEYGHLGIMSASTYFQKRTEYTKVQVYRNNITYLLINFVIIASGVAVLRAKGLLLQDYSWTYMVIGMVFVLLTYMNVQLINFYVADERILEVNKCTISVNLFKSIFITILWITGFLNVFTFIISQALPILISCCWLKFGLKIKYKFYLNRKLLISEFKFGILVYIATLFIYLNYKIDQFFIRNSLGKDALGVYSVAVSLAELLFLIPGSVGTAILGRLYNIKNDDADERKHITAMTVKYTFYVCLIIGVCGMIVSPLIPYVYGNDFRGAVLPTAVLFVGIIFASIGKVSSSYYQSIGKPINHLIITTVTFVVNLVLNIVLIPVIGILGAAIASTVSYTIYGLFYVVFFVVKDKFRMNEFFSFSKYEIDMFKNGIGKVTGRFKK